MRDGTWSRGVSVDSHDFRQAMRCLAGAVTIVATRCGDVRSGLTATSVCSLSLTPPSLLACVNLRGRTYRLIERSRCMSVNVLATRHEPLARRFAGLVGDKDDDGFAYGDWREHATGAPLLNGCLASFDCRVDEMFVAHTHAIVIGVVTTALTGVAEPPLLYLNGRFRTLEALADESVHDRGRA